MDHCELWPDCFQQNIRHISKTCQCNLLRNDKEIPFTVWTHTQRYALSTPFFHEMPLRWINNTIGLHNHREFVIMVGTLLLIAFLGMGIDLVLLSSFLGTIASQTFRPSEIVSMVLVALHLGYCFALLALAGPILRIHVGLISRNELAQEPDCRKLTVKSFFWYSTH